MDHFSAKKYLNAILWLHDYTQLYLVEVFYLRCKKYDCKIMLSWTDCKSKLDQQCK